MLYLASLQDYYPTLEHLLDEYFGECKDEDDIQVIKDAFRTSYASQLQRECWYQLSARYKREREYYPKPTSFVVNCYLNGYLCDLILTLDDGTKIEEHFDYLPTPSDAYDWAQNRLYDRYLVADYEYAKAHPVKVND